MPSTTRKPFSIGGSQGITIPQGMNIGEKVTVAADDRLMLVDVTGEVPEDRLTDFFVTDVEPKFNGWWENEKRHLKDVKMYIPKSLWDQVYKASAELRSAKETYSEAQQNFIEGAILELLERLEKERKAE